MVGACARLAFCDPTETMPTSLVAPGLLGAVPTKVPNPIVFAAQLAGLVEPDCITVVPWTRAKLMAQGPL